MAELSRRPLAQILWEHKTHVTLLRENLSHLQSLNRFCCTHQEFIFQVQLLIQYLEKHTSVRQGTGQFAAQKTSTDNGNMLLASSSQCVEILEIRELTERRGIVNTSEWEGERK